ncbi:MAG: hypothetical protein H6741_33530 [Alphaproteobacteria bacterium]|nr:hypothetical protein [Alphaproteobacteria bacterium]
MPTLLLSLALLMPAMAAEPADECPIQPDEYTARVDAVRELVAFAEPSAEAELTQLELLLVACVDGPVSRDTIVRLILAQGAYEILRDGGDAARGDRYLGWAATLGGPEAWDASYGPDVEKRFNAVARKKPGLAVLDLSFADEVTVVSVDGEVIYEYGLTQVKEGRHVVQWSTGERWFADVVEVEAGGRRLVGGGPPTPSVSLGGTPTPGEGEEEDWREPLGTFSFFVGGGVDKVSGQAHYGGWGGGVDVLLPVATFEVWYKGMGWWLGVDGAFTGAASNSGLAMPRHAGFSGGLAWGERFSGRFGVGLVGATLPTTLSPTTETWAPPVYENAGVFGGRTSLELSFGDKIKGSVRGDAALLSGGLSVSGGAGVGVLLGPVRPYLGAQYGMLSRRGEDDAHYNGSEEFADIDRDQYNWIRAEGGLWYAF